MTRADVGNMRHTTATYDTLHAGTLTGTGAPQQLANLPNVRMWQIIVQADPDNGASVFVGNQNVQPFEVVAGAALTIPIDRTTKVYVNAAANDVVNWLGMG